MMIFFLLPFPAESLNVQVEGNKIVLTWKAPQVEVKKYEIYRIDEKHDKENPLLLAEIKETKFVDTLVKPNINYSYLVRTYVNDTIYTDTDWSKPVKISNLEKIDKPWFDTKKLPVLIFLIIFSFLFFYYYYSARIGKVPYIRRIAGLEAIDDAVGRATEMGRPIIYTTGIGTLSDPSIIAGIAILKYVAKKVAGYGIDLIVPNNDPLIMLASREAVKEGFTEAGRPDLYREENIMFLTTEQFGFTAGFNGIVIRERPGAAFYQGYFYAESLLMAETSYNVGAINIAGTTAVTQLPFFIVSCDYTLIGEELYAASAYLSKNPSEIGTIKAEDVAKIIIIFIILLGSLLLTLSEFGILRNLAEIYVNMFKVGG
ncbi:MAG: fibronectin type III domain-containing protein [Candidatus Hydrothermia bacterium]|nr:fibronectin type III domain-containing protein [Candidatus Hydrothermia bacterium]